MSGEPEYVSLEAAMMFYPPALRPPSVEALRKRCARGTVKAVRDKSGRGWVTTRKWVLETIVTNDQVPVRDNTDWDKEAEALGV